MSNRRRTENFSVRFVEQRAEGWAFYVGNFFRMQLDIRLDQRMDVIANKEKKERLGRPLTSGEKIIRAVWTQGDPPAYSFGRGHIFHEVGTSNDGIRRSIVVLLGKPDPGALVERETTDEAGSETTLVAETEEADGKEGFVDYEVLTYRDGVLVVNEEGHAIKEQSSRTQAGFVELLRTGR
jgi:hypothetical protein